MILKFNQITVKDKGLNYNNPTNEHEIYFNNKLIGTANCSEMSFANMTLLNRKYYLKAVEDFGFKISKDNKQIAAIVKKEASTKAKVLWWSSSWFYDEFVYNDETYSVYEIGFGKKDQHYWQFEKDDKVVAIIQKPTKVVNFLDNYIAYFLDKKFIEITSLWCLYLESVQFYNSMINETGNYINCNTICTFKITRDRFDNTFISKAKSDNLK